MELVNAGSVEQLKVKQKKSQLTNTKTKYWIVVLKLGGVYHGIKTYKRKSDAVNLLLKLELNKPLEKFELVLQNSCASGKIKKKYRIK